VEFTDAQIAEVMTGLGLTRDDLRRVRTNQRALDALRSRIKKAYKRLVLTLHPDRTGGDPEKAALFQLATEVVQEIEKMEAGPPRHVKWAVRIKAVTVS
jgi:hypothetical protein